MKRSSQVALLLMGVTGVGAAGFAMTPERACVQPGTPPSAREATIVGSPPKPECPPRSSSSSSTYRSSGGVSSGSWSRTNSNSAWGKPVYTRTTTRTTSSTSVPLVAHSGASTRTGTSQSTTIAHGGFGSTGHAMSSGS